MYWLLIVAVFVAIIKIQVLKLPRLDGDKTHATHGLQCCTAESCGQCAIIHSADALAMMDKLLTLLCERFHDEAQLVLPFTRHGGVGLAVLVFAVKLQLMKMWLIQCSDAYASRRAS